MAKFTLKIYFIENWYWNEQNRERDDDEFKGVLLKISMNAKTEKSIIQCSSKKGWKWLEREEKAAKYMTYAWRADLTHGRGVSQNYINKLTKSMKK